MIQVPDYGKADSDAPAGERDANDAQELYRCLEQLVLPLYCGDPDGLGAVMRGALALNGSVFNTQRMLRAYAARAYLGAASTLTAA